MTTNEEQEHQDLIAKTIHYLETMGHKNIQAVIDGYESPKSYLMKSSGLEVIPDIVSESVSGKVHYIEVGMKSSKTILLKSKWKLLKTLADIKVRGFQVITHRGHYSFTDKLIDEMNLGISAVRI